MSPLNDIIDNVNDLPLIREVLTDDSGDYSVRAEDRQTVAAFVSPGGETFIAVTPESVGTEAHERLHRRLLKSADGGAPAKLLCTERMIDYIYSNGNLDANVRTRSTMELGDTEYDKLLQTIINDAQTARASDLHIHQQHERCVIRMRVNRRLEMLRSITPNVGEALKHLMYNNLDQGTAQGTFNEKEPADGRLKTKINGKAFRLRWSYTPAVRGTWCIVMRLSDGFGKIPRLADLNYLPPQIHALRTMSRNVTGGMLIFAAPVNNGKTTTLDAAIQEALDVHGISIKVTTIEDPAETPKDPNVIQTEILRDPNQKTSDISQLYTKKLNNALRTDNNIIMFGELRDRAGIAAAIDAVLTGHLILTTIHANDAFAAVERLIQQLPDPMILGSRGIIRGVVANRLLPWLCPKCSIPLEDPDNHEFTDLPASLTEKEKQEFIMRLVNSGIDLGKTRLTGVGCDQCRDGVKGMLPVAEVFIPDDTCLRLIKSQNITALRQYWAGRLIHRELDGFRMIDHAIMLIKEGKVDPFAVEQSVGLIAPTDKEQEHQAYYQTLKDL